VVNYILSENHEVVPVGVVAWAEWFENAERQVALYKSTDWWVSTVFIGIDYSYGMDEEPLVFETMVNYKGEEVIQERHHTWDDAVDAHEEIVFSIEYLDGVENTP
jgi:hypothetical protein